MTVPVVNPGTTTDVAASYIVGNVPPSTPGAMWEYYDRALLTVAGTDLLTNGWGATHNGTGGYHWTVPPGAPQGGDPDGTGRYELRTDPAFVALGP